MEIDPRLVREALLVVWLCGYLAFLGTYFLSMCVDVYELRKDTSQTTKERIFQMMGLMLRAVFVSLLFWPMNLWTLAKDYD